ncbi:MAG: response regulator, partial [Planctomycetaceae bacterium]
MRARALEVSRRILVIDDNPAIHADFRKVLGGGRRPQALLDAAAALFGERPAAVADAVYEVDTASQGEEGLAMLCRSLDEQRPYDVAFVDMRMPPGWDGLETIERLWQVDRELHVVICTAYSDYSAGEIFERLGRNDRLLILKKPFDSIEVEQLAAALSEKRQLLRERARYTRRLEDRVR